MSLHLGNKEICEITYVNDLGVEVTVCEVAIGYLGVFGCPLAPTVKGTGIDYNGGEYQFKVEDFTTGFVDPNGDNYKNLKFITLPDVGVISYSGTPVVEDQVIDLASVADLKYNLPVGYTVVEGGLRDDVGNFLQMSGLCFGFQVSDDSVDTLYSETVETCLLLDSAASVPTVSDNQGDLTGNLYTFSTASFTKDFADADGDQYNQVIIKSAPDVGVFQYNGVTVAPGFSFSAANASNLQYLLSDKYAIYDGGVYDFGRSLNKIIEEYVALGYELTTNDDGILNFSDVDNNLFKTVTGTKVQEDITFDFSVTDNSPNQMESDAAVFTLIPVGNINVFPAYASFDDITVNTKIGVETPITIAMIDAAYQDPQGDPWIETKVNEIDPANTGIFRLSGTPVFVGQIITRAQVAAGSFTHLGENEDTFKLDILDISVRDSVEGPWIN